MKKVIKTNGLTICMAVSETSDVEGSTALRIYEMIQAAIDNDGAVIYNGNDEQVEVPFLARLRQMHPDFVEGAADYEGPFEGWDNVNHIYMIDGARCSNDKFIKLVVEKFSPEIVEIWGQTIKAATEHTDMPIFLGADCAAVRCTLEGDTWFEYIITKHHERFQEH